MSIRFGRAPTASKFEERYAGMLRRISVPAGDKPIAHLKVSRSGQNWIEDTLVPHLGARTEADVHRMRDEVYNTAVVLGVLAFFAEDNKLVPFLVTPGADVRSRTPLPQFQPLGDAVTSKTHLANDGWSSLVWADSKGHREDVAYRGILILGALASAAEGSGVAILGTDRGLFAQIPKIHVAGAAPYLFLPPQPGQ